MKAVDRKLSKGTTHLINCLSSHIRTCKRGVSRARGEREALPGEPAAEGGREGAAEADVREGGRGCLGQGYGGR